MRALPLYLDTSVIGGYYDAAFMADTRALWRLMEQGVYHFYTSRVTMNELQDAPLIVRELSARKFLDPSRILDIRPEAYALARAYIAAGVVPARYTDDAMHVAVATCENLDLIASWNFKHLASTVRNERFNAVNLLHGRPLIRIVPPSALLRPNEDVQES